MIGSEGQYLFRFNLGGKKDFIEEPSLDSFIIIESSGFSLPTFELEFSSEDESILTMLNDGTPLNVQYGINRDNLIDAQLYVNNFPMIKEGLTERTYILSGFVNNIAYLNQPRNQITNPTSGIQAAIDCASRYFKVIGNAKSSMDKQRWIQARMTDAHFLKETILHSLAKNNSFFGAAITSAGECVIKDIKAHLREKNYDWRFTQSPSAPNDVNFDPSFGIESRAGIISSMMGYGREKILYDIESGTSRTLLERAKPLLSLSQDLALSKDIQKRNASLGIINENVHSQYHDAYQRNITNLLTLSSICLTATLNNSKYIPIRPLDTVMFKDKSVEGTGTNQSSEYHSGLYMVSTVSRELKQKRYTTTVEMCRESFNQVKV